MEFADILPSEDEDFDPITGLKDEEGQRAEITSELNKVINQAQAFDALKRMPGWALLEKFISGQVEWMTSALKVERDHSKIIRLQSEILAFESLPNIIEKSFYDADEAHKKLLEMVSDTY